MSQKSNAISIIDNVQVLNNNHAETLFYYENNRLVLRIKALEKGYISDYQFLEILPNKTVPFSFIIITAYKAKRRIMLARIIFKKRIALSDGLKLLNNKIPSDFRKVILHNNRVKHHTLNKSLCKI